MLSTVTWQPCHIDFFSGWPIPCQKIYLAYFSQRFAKHFVLLQSNDFYGRPASYLMHSFVVIFALHEQK